MAHLASAGHAFVSGDGPDQVRLLIGAPVERAVVLGAYQRASDGPLGALRVRRASGGGAVRVGPGSLWLALSLGRADALVAGSTPDKLLNRYVRPLLRALGRTTGAPASYFGRDWISALGPDGARHPIAIVGFAHDGATGRCLFEALVAVSEPLVAAGDPVRASFRGQATTTLEALAGRPIALDALVSAIASAYGRPVDAIDRTGLLPDHGISEDPPWAAIREEAIGAIGAGPDREGRFRIGGELMVSIDALARLEDRIEALRVAGAITIDAVSAAVDEELTGTRAVLFGVRSLASIRDVILEACRG